MRRPLALLAGALALACSHSGPVDIATLSSNSDQVVWEAGQKAAEKKNWEAARQHFKRIIDGFPQSELGPAARLALADSHYKEGGIANLILAISEYRDFLTLYPSHPRSDYAQFQVAEAYFKQKNSPDRDQTPTVKALEEFQRLLELYPGSTFAENARQRIFTCRQALAEHEFRVGFFYQRTRKAYRSSISRFEGLLSEFPDYERLDSVLFRLAQCLSVLGRYAEALPHVDRLLQEYPTSEHVEEARQMREDLVRATPAPPPSPAPPAVAEPATPPPSPSPGPGQP